jgi:hypothetical protein
MERPPVKFGEWIEKGFNLYRAHLGILLPATLIAILLSAVTLGILAGPMLAGLLFITLALHDGKAPRPEFSNVFRGFDYFQNSLLFVLGWGLATAAAAFIIGLVPGLGHLAALFLVYAVQAFLMFGLFLIVDRRMDFWPASLASIQLVKRNFWPFLGFSAVASVIGSLGVIACGIGLFLTASIQACILTVSYRELFPVGEPAFILDGEPTPPPPPPTAAG